MGTVLGSIRSVWWHSAQVINASDVRDVRILPVFLSLDGINLRVDYRVYWYSSYLEAVFHRVTLQQDITNVS